MVKNSLTRNSFLFGHVVYVIDNERNERNETLWQTIVIDMPHATCADGIL